MIRWLVLERVPQATSWWGRVCFTSKSSWWSAQPDWLPPTVTVGGGLDALPGLIFPIVVGGVWLMYDPCPWMLVKILAAFVPVHGFLLEASGFLTGILDPVWVGTVADVRIPLIGLLSRSMTRQVSTPGNMLLGMLALLFVR
jgi:hypothetical protein